MHNKKTKIWGQKNAANVHGLWRVTSTSPAVSSTQRQRSWTLAGMHGCCSGRPTMSMDATGGISRGWSLDSRGIPRDPLGLILRTGGMSWAWPKAMPRDIGHALGLLRDPGG